MKNEKKGSLLKKTLVTGGLLTATIHGLNRAVDALASLQRSKQPPESDTYGYDTKYGTLRYKKTGRGAPLLLIHGLHNPMGLAEWDKCSVQLSKFYTVYSLELLGFGYSNKPKITYSAYLFSSLINGFIRDIIKEPAFVAANGAGAGVSLAASILQPRYFKKIILISPIGAGSMKLPAKGLTRRLLELPVLGTAFYNTINSKLVSNILLKSVYLNESAVSQELLNSCYLSAHHDTEGAKYSYAAAMSNFFGVDLERLIKKTAVPVHVVWGDGDILNPISNFNYLAAEGEEQISITIFEGTKQYPHYENPKAFFKVCRWFFE